MQITVVWFVLSILSYFLLKRYAIHCPKHHVNTWTFESRLLVLLISVLVPVLAFPVGILLNIHLWFRPIMKKEVKW